MDLSFPRCLSVAKDQVGTLVNYPIPLLTGHWEFQGRRGFYASFITYMYLSCAVKQKRHKERSCSASLSHELHCNVSLIESCILVIFHS